jgi:hypothetical protein
MDKKDKVRFKSSITSVKKLTLALISVTMAFAFFCEPLKAQAQEWIKPSDALRYVGRAATVCGQVASTNFATRSRGRPTFLNLDRPYPNHIFTVVIWGENRDRFSEAPEQAYRSKRMCVTGTITTSRRLPQILVGNPSQIRMEN